MFIPIQQYFTLAAVFLLYCTTMIFNFLQFNILFILVLGTSTTFVFPFANDITDEHALLSFKNSITNDPSSVLDSWNSSVHFCQWTGIECSLRRQRVTLLDISSLNLVGTLSPHIGNLSFLRTIYLYDNNFHGSIPNEIGRLFRLQYLYLESNSLSGMVPQQLYNNSLLRVFVLTKNELEGTLPTDLGFTLPKLQKFYVGSNRFSGPLPPSIVNASNLVILAIRGNNITGPIPNNWGSLPNLRDLNLGQNPLGENMRPNDFFSSLVNCTHLKVLGLEETGLRGQLPNSIVNLSITMEYLYMYGNRIQGSIPGEIGKLVNMIVLSLDHNLLTGTIPESIGTLSKLGFLNLSANNISGSIPTSMSNITQLVELYLDNN